MTRVGGYAARSILPGSIAVVGGALLASALVHPRARGARDEGSRPDGRCRTRTCDIYDVNVALYQLS